MLAAGRQFPDRVSAVEGRAEIGRHIAQPLVADGENCPRRTDEVQHGPPLNPSTRRRRQQQLSKGRLTLRRAHR